MFKPFVIKYYITCTSAAAALAGNFGPVVALGPCIAHLEVSSF